MIDDEPGEATEEKEHVPLNGVDNHPKKAPGNDDTTHAYPPLSQIRKSLRVKWYRCPIQQNKLRTLSIRTDSQGWKQCGGHFLLFLSIAALTLFLWSQQSWLAFIICLWCLGFVSTFFKGTAVHELGHGTVFKTKKLNAVFLHLFSLISWWDPYDYAASHTYHHRYTTHREADRENVLPLTPSLHPWLLLQLISINLFSKPARNFGKGGFIWTVYLTLRTASGKASGHTHIPSQEWLHTLHRDQPVSFKRSIRWSQILLAFHSTVLLLSLLSGWWVLPLVITLPAYIANLGSYLLGTTQHCGLMENHADFRKNTRSITIHPFLEFLYWHMNWHTEHHMYAGVPCYNLKYLAKELETDMPRPRTLLGAWKEMRHIWQKQLVDPDYEFGTSVPKTAMTKPSPLVDELVVSIGDLEPEDYKHNYS